MKKILLLTDFSEASRNALQFVRSFFSDTVTDIHLLTVYSVKSDGVDGQPPMSLTARKNFADQLFDMVAELRRENPTGWHTFRSTSRPGDLIEVVLDELGIDNYDYVVVGTKKAGANQLFGQSATTLVRKIHANVLVIPSDAIAGPVRNVVLATDFSSLKNYRLLFPIKELVTLKGSLLTLLSIDKPGKEIISTEQETNVRKFIAPVEPVVTHFQAPTAKEGIDTYVDGHSVDMLVTIPSHKGWVDALTEWSASRSLAYTSPIPLLIMYDDGSSDRTPVADNTENTAVTLLPTPVKAKYKVLLMTDFSAASRHALSFAQDLFAEAATDFCLTNAFPFEPEMSYGGAFWLEEEQQETQKNLHHLKETVTKLPQPDFHTYRTSIILGEPVQAVERLLKQEHFDLIVLGTTGAGRSSLFGSVATGMVRQATTNVLVVPTSAPIRPVEQLVLATDFASVNDAESLTLLKEIADRKAATLTLLTVEKRREKPSDISRQYVLQALAGVKTQPFEIQSDDVLTGINVYLDTHTVDVLVMLPHHTGLFDVLRNKSISRAVAYNPRVPLLTLYDGKNKVNAIDVLDETIPVTSSL